MGPLLLLSSIGNVKDIIDSSKAAQDEYLNRFDQIRGYMVAMNVPNETMDRVKLWCQVRPPSPSDLFLFST